MLFCLLTLTIGGNTNLTDSDSILCQEEPLEKIIVTHPGILAREITWTEEPWWATDHGVAKEWDNLTTKQQQMMWDICNFSQIHKTRFVFLTYLKFCWGIDSERLSGVFPDLGKYKMYRESGYQWSIGFEDSSNT